MRKHTRDHALNTVYTASQCTGHIVLQCSSTVHELQPWDIADVHRIALSAANQHSAFLPTNIFKSLIPPTSLISARLPSEIEMTQLHSLLFFFIFRISLSVVIWQTRNLARHATLARTELELRGF